MWLSFVPEEMRALEAPNFDMFGVWSAHLADFFDADREEATCMHRIPPRPLGMASETNSRVLNLDTICAAYCYLDELYECADAFKLDSHTNGPVYDAIRSLTSNGYSLRRLHHYRLFVFFQC